MHFYVKFVETELLPLTKQFDDAALQKVRFDDLWFLFKVGQIVCDREAVTALTAEEKGHVRAVGQCLWRVFSVTTVQSPRSWLRYPKLDRENPGQFMKDDYPDEAISGYFRVSVYYIDWNGKEFGAVEHSFFIPSYQGERDIRSLPCYPLHYRHDSKSRFENFKIRGQEFCACLASQHRTHNGWTLDRTPSNVALYRTTHDAEKKRPIQTEYISGHVIVDFEEAFREMPGWKPKFFEPKENQARYSLHGSCDGFKILKWSDRARSMLIDEPKEEEEVDRSIDIDGIALPRNDGLETDPFFKAIQRRQGWPRQFPMPDTALGPDDYALLPRRLFAYVLEHRKFVCVDIVSLRNIIAQSDLFEKLKIRKGYKAMVRCLVSSHFAKSELERKYFGANKTGSPSQDLIHGKGRGLVILLHGVPGVGKTATAEAVAMESCKPLFPITCGLTPDAVEASLAEVFRLAEMWNCVLLFDEADVFLPQRSRFDFKRNALVSVFLRTLEYYNGILFLTTNRVGTLDEAFKSRIHVSLYYPPLVKQQVELIFQMNIEKLRRIEDERAELTKELKLQIHNELILKFAKDHCVITENRNSGRWNGRQIRNAFQMAASLARYDYEDKRLQMSMKEGKPPVLDGAHFKQVESATEAFTSYLEETKGYNDSDLLHIQGNRNDFFQQKLPAATGPVATATAATYQEQSAYPHSYAPPNHRVGDYPVQGAQYPMDHAQAIHFGQPETLQLEPGRYAAGGAYDIPTSVRPGQEASGSLETPRTLRSEGWSNEFAGWNAPSQPYRYEGNQNAAPRQTEQ